MGGGNFQWTQLPGGSPNSLSCTNCTSPIASPTVTTKYVATSTINPYCTNTNIDTVTVGVLDAPIFKRHGDTITCPHNPVKLDLQPNPPTGVTYRYKWTPSTALDNDTIPDPTSNPNNSVTYKVKITTSTSVCADYDTVVVDVLTGMNLENPDTAICAGQSVQVRATGDSRYTYNWLPDPLSGASFSDPNIINPLITPSVTSKFNYVLKASHANCTDSILSFNIEVQPIPKVTVDQDAKICFGDTMRLHGNVTPANYNFNLAWTPGSSLDKPNTANPIFTANTVGTQTLKLVASTSAGCADSDQVDLTVFPAKFLTVSNDTAICAGDSVQLHLAATGAKTFNWFPDMNISNNAGLDPYVWPTTTQTYHIYGIDTNSCADTEAVTVTIKPAAVLDIPDSVHLYPGQSYHIQPGGNCLYYTWFPNVGLDRYDVSNPLAAPAVNTRYYVNAMTEAGCATTDSIDIIVMPDSYLDVPNAFTPGAGGINNLLKPIHLGDATLKVFAIYNRWGVKMFETKDINQGWDGTYNGQPQPMGVYIYNLEATTPAGRTFTKQGNVTLVR